MRTINQVVLAGMLAAAACGPAACADQAAPSKAVLVACLQEIRTGVEALVQKYPADLGHLGPGVIDPKGLSLAFPIADPQRRPRQLPGAPSRPAKEGLYMQLVSPLSAPAPLGETVHCWWPFSNVGFTWSWAWAGAFQQAAQQNCVQVLEDALRPLDKIENDKIAADLAGRGNASYVLRGTPGIELAVKVSKVEPDGPCKIGRAHV